MGWLLLISISFAIPSVSDILATNLPLQLGQVFLNVLGKRGMLAIWSMIIVVQVSNAFTLSKHYVYPTFGQYVTGAAQVVDASRVVFAFARDNALPGSRYLKKINPYTQTPVNAVWFVVSFGGLCGVLGFSGTALTSLAG